MKKVVSLLLATLLMGVMVSCSSSKKDANGVVYNEKYDEEKMENVKGKEVTVKDNEDVILCKTSGFAFQTPANWQDVKSQDGIKKYPLDPEAYYIMYMPKEQVDKVNSIDKDKMSEDEVKAIKKAANASVFNVFAIYRVNEDEEETVKDAEEYKADFKNNEEIGKVDKNTFYFAYNDEVPSEGFSEDDKADIQKLMATIKEVRESVILFPPTDPMDDFKVSMESFKTTDLDGNEINQDILKDYDVTMVNVWATWCKYCVSEMPEIEKLYEKLPEKTNIITICTDGTTKKEEAKNLLSQTGAKFKTINSNDELQEKVIDYVKGYPTTFFVDKTGKVIGKLQIGTPAEEGKITDAYLELLKDALSSVK
ncbi:MAG: TlpA family protein disulfide reductase [Clostridium sp.]|nr:TlpA family protein disulfide reductase [Clostridium sp.]